MRVHVIWHVSSRNVHFLRLRLMCKPTGSAFRPTVIRLLGSYIQAFTPQPRDLVCRIDCAIQVQSQLLCTD
jgi:hypothetical protein